MGKMPAASTPPPRVFEVAGHGERGAAQVDGGVCAFGEWGAAVEARGVRGVLAHLGRVL